MADRNSRGASWAQDDGWSNNNAQERETRLQGTIDGFRSVDISTNGAQADEHSFVRLRLENGESKIVCLGTRVDLRDLSLESGKDITVVGKKARIDGENVIVAERIDYDDTVYRISKDERPEVRKQTSQNRNATRANQDQFHSRAEYRDDKNPSQPVRNNDKYDRETTVKDTTGRAGAYWSDDQGWSDNSHKQPRETRLNGTVDGFSVMNISTDGDNADEQTFVRIRLEDGNSKIVSLGRRVALDELGLESGKDITVSGKEKRIDGNDVLVAEQINYGDEVFRIRKEDRPKVDALRNPSGERNRLRDNQPEARRNSDFQTRQLHQNRSDSPAMNHTGSANQSSLRDDDAAGTKYDQSR